MKKISLITSLLFVALSSAQKVNSLLDPNFWRKNPDVSTVKLEIEKGNDPTALNPSAFDPVTLAINNGASNDVVKFLIEQKGNEINKVTHDGRIYLHWASSKGNVELVEYLIEKGANIYWEDTSNNTPLVFALGNGQNNQALFEAYFKAGLDIKKKYKNGANLLLLAVASDKDLHITNYLISKGLSFKDVDQEGNTLFDYAARTGNLTNLKTLYGKGVKPTANALLFAAEGTRRSANSIEIFQYLVDELKIKPTVLSKNQESVLHFLAKKENQLPIITYFKDKGVALQTADGDGNTVLHYAASGRDLALVNYLLEQKVSVNSTNKKGETPLTQAVKSGSIDVISTLLKHGANITVLDQEGQPLAYHLVQNFKAPRGGNDDFLDKIKLLKDNGLVLNRPFKDGNTMYHIAVAKNDLQLIKKLEGLGIDINTRNAEGLTALHKAALVAKDDIILKYLLSLNANKSIKTDLDETAYDLAKENEVLIQNEVNIDFLK